MVRVGNETIWVVGPCLADEFVGYEATETLEAAREVVRGDEIVEVAAELRARLPDCDGKLNAIPVELHLVGPSVPGWHVVHQGR
jgi:hypothetical protein